jgi:hypothetical protein
MKSFKEFLSEEEARQGKLLTNKGTAQDFRNPKKIPFTGTDPTPSSSSSESPEAPRAPKSSPGQMEIPSDKTPTGTTTKVPGSKVRGAAADPWKQFPKKPGKQRGLPKTGPSSTLPGRSLAPAGGTTAKPSLPAAGQTQKGGALATTPKGGAPATNPPIQAVKVSDVTKPKGKLASGTKGGTLATRPVSTTAKTPPINAVNVRDITPKAPKLPSGASSAAKEAEKAATKAATKTVGKGLLRGLGKIAGPASAALDVADERSKGSGWARSLAKGAVVAAGGALGGAGGSVAGPVGTVGGAVGGSMAASKAFDTVAGANAKERKAIATTNRQSQSGGALKGVGGKTTFDTKKNTITSGGKTAQLGKTSVVTNPKTGKQEVGNLAYKDGKAVYKRSDTKSLAQTSSNPLERIGRSLFAGAYKKSDAANAAKKLATARQSDAARNKALGVKMLPGK